MKVRSVNEVQSLDDELNLFEEDNWDFMAVLDNHDTNYEYFNDIRDTDFDKKSSSVTLKSLAPMICVAAFLLVAGFVTMKAVGVFDSNEDYQSVANTVTVKDSVSLQRVEGKQADSSELIDISKVLQTYFDVLRSESDYTQLNDYCKNSSTFSSTYYTCTDKVVSLYDNNDCYARALREFGSFCSVGKVNEVIVKDNIYYCYVNLNIPSSNDIYEYIYLYSYNMTKFFNMNDLTEANMVKYLLETTAENPISCTQTEYCLKFVKTQDGSFKIVDDSSITSICTDAYTNAISQMSSILGGNLTS